MKVCVNLPALLFSRAQQHPMVRADQGKLQEGQQEALTISIFVNVSFCRGEWNASNEALHYVPESASSTIVNPSLQTFRCASVMMSDRLCRRNSSLIRLLSE